MDGWPGPVRLARYCRILVLVWVTAAAGAGSDADTAFAAGMRAFRAGDAAGALAHFERAWALGRGGSDLIYNLGVVYYLTADLERAREYFARLLDHPSLAGVAEFNLGLVAVAAGDPARAADHFGRVAAASDDPRLHALARERLGELVASPVDQPHAGWRSVLSLGGGYDDSLVDPAEELAGAESDLFAEVFASAIRTDPASGPVPEFEAGGYLLRYPAHADSDFALLRLSAAWPGRTSNAALRAALFAEPSWLGGDRLQTGAGIELRGLFEPAEKRELRIDYRLEHIDAGADFAQLQGLQQSLAGRWQAPAAAYRYALAYGLEWNDRRDRLDAEGFTSYSPVRHSFEGSLLRRTPGGLELGVGSAVRLSRYRDPDLLPDGSEVRRRDQRREIFATLAGAVTATWSWQLEYRHTDNRSNRAGFEFSRNLLSFALVGALD